MDAGLAVAKARAVIDALRIDAPERIDVEAIAALRGLICEDGGISGAVGRLVRGAHGGVIRVRGDVRNEGRYRFTIAHEMGHFELHAANESSICTSADLDCWSAFGKEDEYQANVFAAELLMPESLFVPRCRGVRPSLEHVDCLASAFRTSFTATAIRFAELCPEECAVVLSEAGKIRWGYPGRQFRFKFFESGADLDAYTIAYDYFAGRSTDRKQQSVDAEAWFPRIKFRQGAMIKEQSWELGDLGVVLSLLWIDQDV
jgi:hypothetical protein